MDAKMQKDYMKGGAFLIEGRKPAEIFTPEDLNDEQKMIGDTTKEFVDNEVIPHIAAMEAHDWEKARELVHNAGELGLLGANISEEYGGLGLDQTTGVVIAENMGRASGFGVTFGAQTSIGLLPIFYFGSEELKQKYIPPIVSGEKVTAYCLSESGSGSDALGAKCNAKLSEDGTHYVLNGEKMWISNGSFSDIYIVFAKVDGDKKKFSAFVVERSESCRPGTEEHKMGIKSSSTTPLILSDCKVPVENLIGEVGDGAKIAFNILNVGRFKLGASCTGGMKLAVHNAIRYANERQQFNVPISSFGAMKHKLAEMAIRTWVAESMTYRTVGMIDALIGEDGGDREKKLRSIEEYSVESSINKVACSEALDYVVDEMVQIYGGAGYSADYPAEKAYRDARINRIFEGTNEINRMLIPGMLMKKAMKGQLALIPAAKALMDEILNPQMSFDEDEGTLAAEMRLALNAKKIALMILGTAAQKYMMELDKQQEILLSAADIIIESYAMETAILRAQKLAEKGDSNAERYVDMAGVYCNDAIQRIEATAKNSLAAMMEGDEMRTMLVALRRFTKNNTPINTVAARQRIAGTLIAANKYVF